LELGKYISKNDALIMLEITNVCCSCHSRESFRDLIERFKTLVYSDGLVIATHVKAGLMFSENIPAKSINVGYPAEYLDLYLRNKYNLIDPLYQQFFKTSKIQCFRQLEPLYSKNEYPIIQLNKDFGIINKFIYGISSSDLDYFTGISISGQEMENNQRTRTIIEYLMPYLSIAIQHLIPIHPKEDVIALTLMEKEVLRWLNEGKSSWEISRIMNKSERTINYHVGNLLKKLNASNRTHAVAIALEKDLIVE